MSMEEGLVECAPVLVVGAGPAGMSCALWLHNLGLRPWLIDQAGEAGGLMNANTLPNNWVLGQIAQTGPQMASQFARHLASLPIRVDMGVERFAVNRQGDALQVAVWTTQGVVHQPCAAVVLATGTRVRGRETLGGIPGIDSIEARRVCYGPAAFENLALAAQGRTVIIGGGDNAVENAHMLLMAGGEVVLLARSEFRAQAALMSQLIDQPRVRLLQQASVQQIEPTAAGMALSISSPQGLESIEAQRLHVLVGYEPNGNLEASFEAGVWSAMQHDAQGYLCVDSWGRCGAKGIYAAGDVCNPVFPNVVSAMSQGAQVAKVIERDLRLGKCLGE
ncbi:NAD(P)/FAD-dependent oxidoreductase [Uliginosibacterium gangwonense]|uniref:NAD(P)/FAD-dependent oxidoreductase n=1 Tax=Uliginosibacterium gangwonense TaxID=392736 RepID=UPI00036CFC5C|nr:NAD(P)/FAD-dependent oxidoreductase [Uliginosibacterium gangwonense]